jgi:hypothetical protein
MPAAGNTNSMRATAMESVMGKYLEVCLFMKVAMLAMMVIAMPTDLSAASRALPTAVAIQDVKSVAGRWSGIVYGRPGGNRGRDWVELAIQEDGTYTVASARMIGVFTSSGTVSLGDGKLTAGGEKARVTFTLYQQDSRRFLRAEGITEEGYRVRADLYPAP